MQIIPAINAESFGEIKNKIKTVDGLVEWVQLDVCDGTFTPNTIWHEPSDLLGLETSSKIEVHLMVNRLEDGLEKWFLPPVHRIIFHLEAVDDPYFIIEKCKKAAKEVGLAIGPDTSWTSLVPFYGKADVFQILSVRPGIAGQSFIENSLEKIIRLRENCPDCIIEVDGGVTYDIAKKVFDAGADIVTAATAIFGEKDIKKAIEKFKNIK